MVVVEPLVSEEKLRQLLDEQAESTSLDFKAECDLSSKASLVELAKDVGAMQMHGGYIVVGANDRGEPMASLPAENARLFDEARLRSKLRKWISEPLELLSARHEIDRTTLVLIYVGPNPQGLAIFRADGQYVTEGREVTAFRKGDVFTRHGSASEPWGQTDLEHVLDKVTETRKERWRRGLAADFARLGEDAGGRQLASAPASALTWNLDAGSFEATLVEQLRTDDQIPLRLLLERLPREAASLARDEQLQADIPTLFDRLACVAALGLRVDRPWMVDAAIEAAGDIYDIGFDIERAPKDWAVAAPAFWLGLLERLICVGALAVRLKRWQTVRVIALRRGEARDWRSWPSWVGHGMTMAARSKLFLEEEGGRQVEKSLLSLAHRLAVQLDCLHGGGAPGDERLLDSICQFDALAAIAVIAEAGSFSTSHLYPNFARFYTSRTEPIIVRLLSDDTLRQAIFPQSDGDLATTLRSLNLLARRESFRYAGWDGFDDARILGLLKAHPTDT